jgi:hypothetical protein
MATGRLEFETDRSAAKYGRFLRITGRLFAPTGRIFPATDRILAATDRFSRA